MRKVEILRLLPQTRDSKLGESVSQALRFHVVVGLIEALEVVPLGVYSPFAYSQYQRFRYYSVVG